MAAFDELPNTRRGPDRASVLPLMHRSGGRILCPISEGVGEEQHRGGIVVDDGGVPGPVNSRIRPRTWSSRSPRAAPPMSNSSATAERMASTAALMALSGSIARPRLACSTVPVRLNPRRRLGMCSHSSRPSARMAIMSALLVAPPRIAWHAPAMVLRTAAIVASWPKRLAAIAPACVRSTYPHTHTPTHPPTHLPTWLCTRTPVFGVAAQKVGWLHKNLNSTIYQILAADFSRTMARDDSGHQVTPSSLASCLDGT